MKDVERMKKQIYSNLIEALKECNNVKVGNRKYEAVIVPRKINLSDNDYKDGTHYLTADASIEITLKDKHGNPLEKFEEYCNFTFTAIVNNVDVTVENKTIAIQGNAFSSLTQNRK